MTQKIIIAGSGFAGLWAAISAARAVSLAGKERDIEITVVSPTPKLAIRPCLYEAVLENMNPDIADLLEAVGVRYVGGVVQTIDASARTVTISRNDGSRETVAYDRFVLAAGSQLFRPAIPGLNEFAFETDQLATAEALDGHLKALAGKPATLARNTVVVAGGGFTGLETATEMPIRLRAVLGEDADFRVIIIDAAQVVGDSMGSEALPFVQEALNEDGIETRPGVRVTAVDADGVTLSSGERIETNTLVWTAGLRASPITAQVPGEHDRSAG